MEANKFISNEELQGQVKAMKAEKKDSITFQSGKRVKIAIVNKNSSEYAQYENHMLQFDATIDDTVYAVVCGVK